MSLRCAASRGRLGWRLAAWPARVVLHERAERLELPRKKQARREDLNIQAAGFQIQISTEFQNFKLQNFRISKFHIIAELQIFKKLTTHTTQVQKTEADSLLARRGRSLMA